MSYGMLLFCWLNHPSDIWAGLPNSLLAMTWNKITSKTTEMKVLMIQSMELPWLPCWPGCISQSSQHFKSTTYRLFWNNFFKFQMYSLPMVLPLLVENLAWENISQTIILQGWIAEKGKRETKQQLLQQIILTKSFRTSRSNSHTSEHKLSL